MVLMKLQRCLKGAEVNQQPPWPKEHSGRHNLEVGYTGIAELPGEVVERTALPG